MENFIKISILGMRVCYQSSMELDYFLYLGGCGFMTTARNRFAHWWLRSCSPAA